MSMVLYLCLNLCLVIIVVVSTIFFFYFRDVSMYSNLSTT